MKRGLLLICWAVFQQVAFAQKSMKTDVLVIGNNATAAAAGVQAAMSGVKTIILSNSQLAFNLADEKNISGISAMLIHKKDSLTKTNGSATDMDAFKWLTDSLKNFTLFQHTDWEKLERNGSGWQVKFKNGKSLKAKVLVNATADGELGVQAKGKSKPSVRVDYSNTLYRTSVGSNNNSGRPSIYPLFNMVSSDIPNLVLANRGENSFAEGQAAGATAAYGAFYGVDASKPNLKAIQGELLHYKLNLMPYADVKPADSNWRAMQEIGISGILKVVLTQDSALFKPQQLVTLNEIVEPMKALFYKAQIWFDDHKNAPMTLENVVSMVSYVGNKSEAATMNQIQRNWNESASPFNIKKELTRSEFSAIVKDFLKPIDVTVDKVGRVIR